MKDEMQNIKADSNQKYFHLMLNMWDDDLNAHQYRLLGHYARVAGQEGKCWEGVRKTAKRCHMSPETVIKTRKELAAMGLIRVYEPAENDHESTITVLVMYDWESNSSRFPKNGGVPDSERPGPEMEHPVTKQKLTRSETKEEPYRKNQEEEPIEEEPNEEKITSAGATCPPAAPSSSFKKDRKRENAEKGIEALETSPSNGKSRNMPYDELSELGKFLVGLSGKDVPEGATKTLTWTQHGKLAEEMVAYDGEERIVTIPDSLFIDDPFYKRWIEEVVYPVLRNRSGVDKPVSRDRLVKAVTLAGSDGFNIREYFDWRKPESARAEEEQKRREANDPAIRNARIETFFRDTLGLSDELRSASAAAAEDATLSKEDIRELARMVYGNQIASSGAENYLWTIPSDERERHISLLYRYFKMGLLWILPQLADSDSQRPANFLRVYIGFHYEAMTKQIPGFKVRFSTLPGLSLEFERLLEQA